MSANEPMTAERLAEARAALDEDHSQWGGEYGLDLLAEVERLRARPTVDRDMVERAAFALARKKAQEPLFPLGVPGHVLLEDARTVLDAALGVTRGPVNGGDPSTREGVDHSAT